MRYDPRFHRKGRASRRGIAVMFALGILSLVIVAVLIFSRRAVTDRQVSSAYASYTGSKDLAMSAFGRAILQLQKNASLGTAFYSGGEGDNDVDWLWKMDAAKRIFPTGAKCPVRWQYVYGPDGHIIGRYAYVVMGEDPLKLNAMLDHRFCRPNGDCTGGNDCPRLKRRGNSASELRFKVERDYDDERVFSNYFKMSGSEAFNTNNLQSKTSGGKVVQYSGPEDLFFKRGLLPGSTISSGRVLHLLNSFFNISLSSAAEEPDAWFGGDLNGNHVKDKNEFFQRFPIRLVNWETIKVDDIMKDAVAFYDASGKPVTPNTAGLPWLKNWSDEDAAVGNWLTGDTKARQIAANLINYNASGDRAVVSDVAPSDWSFENVPNYTGNKRTWYLNECGVSLYIQCQRGSKKTHPVKNDKGETIATWYSFGDTGAATPNYMKVRLYLYPEIINLFRNNGTGQSESESDSSSDVAGKDGNCGYDVLPGEYSVKVMGKVSFTYSHWSYDPADWNDDGDGSNDQEFAGGHKYEATHPKEGVEYYCTRRTTDKYDYYMSFNINTSERPDLATYILDSTESIGSFASKESAPAYDQFFMVKDVSINLKMILTRKYTNANGEEVVENVDFASLPEIKTEDGVVTALTSASAINVISKYPGVDDPRHNLHAADWAFRDASLGTSNKNVTYTGATYEASRGWDRDPESGLSHGTNSTAYIRHAPMKSLWELGAIHRAAPWQTINFKRPKAVSLTSNATRLAENLTTAGGGAYGEGDFRLLDQVTMQGGERDASGNGRYTPVAQFGRINLNMPDTAIREFNLRALFMDMKWYSAGTYDQSGSNYSLTSKAKVYTNGLAAKLGAAADYEVPGSNGTERVRLFRRSDIYLTPETATNNFWDLIEKSPYNPATSLTKDAVQEQLICRIIGLTDARTMPDSAIVIVLAQTIQDVGGGVKVYRDWAGDGTIGDGSTVPTTDKARMAAGYFYMATDGNTIKNPGFFPVANFKFYDTTTAEFGRYDNGADRITGETLLQARLQYDRQQGRWKIVQVKYED